MELLEAMVAQRNRTPCPRLLHSAQHRLKADAVLLDAEHLDQRTGVGSRLLGDDIRQLFLNAAASSAVADFRFFARGRCNDQPSAFAVSQPR